MLELWNQSSFWRILINIIGGLSIIVAVYLLYISYKMMMNYLIRKKVKELKNKYAKIYELPSGFLKDDVQIGFELPELIQVKLSVNDLNDCQIMVLHDGELEPGRHVFLLKTSKVDNGEYYLNYKSEIQNINKKMIIKN